MSYDIAGWFGSVAAKYVLPLFFRLRNLLVRRPGYHETRLSVKTTRIEVTYYSRNDDRQL